MNFRLIATTPAVSASGTAYNHIIWMGEFDGLEVEQHEAVEFAREQLGPDCTISPDEIPILLH